MNLERVIDYSCSFTINTAARDGMERNTCRTQLFARCWLVNQDGADRDFVALTQQDRQALIDKVADLAEDGKIEYFKNVA